MPLLLSRKVTPWGRAPDSVRLGVGAPLARTVKLNVDPTVAAALVPVLIDGRALTVSTNAWVTVPTEFVAVSVIGYTPPAVVDGLPLKVAVPLMLVRNVIPEGSLPDSLRIVGSTPRVVTLKFSVVPAVAVAAAALVNEGTFCPVDVPAALTVRVNVWVVVPPALVAVSVIR